MTTKKDSEVYTFGSDWNVDQKKETVLRIEELRRRAKDNKAHNVEFFLSHALASLERIRNLLITLSLAGVGLLHSNLIIVNNNHVGYWLFGSLVVGLTSYIFDYLSLLYESHYYGRKEEVFTSAYPAFHEYHAMLQEESIIKKHGSNILRFLGIVLLFLQAMFLLIAIFPLTVTAR